MESAHRKENGKWILHLMNYGDDEEIILPDGRRMLMPAKALQIVEC